MRSTDFYTQFASEYDTYANEKRLYLAAIDAEIVARKKSCESMIDIGCGTGGRSLRLAEKLKVKDLTLIDQSEGMLSHIPAKDAIHTICADLSRPGWNVQAKADLVVCLWNVFGHIPTREGRLQALKNSASCMHSESILFLDVNNRYNAAHYGIFSVLRNIMTDFFRPFVNNGDYPLTISTSQGALQTTVHLFSPRELDPLFKEAGLVLQRCTAINYRTGKRAATFFGGQLLYELVRV